MPEQSAQARLFKAVSESNFPLVNEILGGPGYYNVNKVYADGKTMLHIATELHQTKIVRELLVAGAREYKQTDDGTTALSIAAEKGYVDIVHEFDMIGTNPDIKNAKGETSLHKAAYNGNPEIINILIKNLGASVNEKTIDGETPLSIAAKKGNIEAVNMLLAAGADKRISDVLEKAMAGNFKREINNAIMGALGGGRRRAVRKTRKMSRRKNRNVKV